MKALYSLWGAPLERDHTGFNTREDFQVSLSLSVLMAARFYPCVLVTDAKGWQQIEPLQLPWQEVILADFDQYQVSTRIWNLSKLVAMTKVKAPFIHLDHDLYLHKPLPDFEGWLFQNPEGADWHEYPYGIQKMNQPGWGSKPTWWHPRGQEAFNCGVIGCKNQVQLELWLKPVLKWLRSHEFQKAHAQDTRVFAPIILEQYTAALCAEAFGWKVRHLFPNMFESGQRAIEMGYTHLLSDSKRKAHVIEKFHAFCQRFFPQQYQLIKSLNYELSHA